MSDKSFFSEGGDAFYFGDEVTGCPYPEGTRERLLWLDGWEEARHDAERRVDFRLPIYVGGSPKDVSRSR